MSALRLGSACSGCGCIDLGLERAGFEPAWQIEINPKRRSVLARHWPTVQRYEDLREVAQNAADLPPVDLLAGGTPCQDWSVAGNRAGMAGDRASLFVDFIRLADQRSIPWILWENVPGVLSQHAGRDFALCLEGFTGARPEVPAGGWRSAGVAWGPLRWCAWRVLDAQAFGVAQRRRRVFVVAGPRDRCAPEILLEPESLPGDPAPGGEAGAVASPVASGSPRGSGYRLDADNLSQLVYDPWNQKASGASTQTLNTRSGNGAPLVVDGAQITHPENRQQPQPERSPSLNTSARLMAYSGELASADPLTRHSHMTVDRAGSCGCGPSNAVVQKSGARRLSPTEYERLQGLPDSWTRWGSDGSELADTPRYQMVGDGAAVPVLEWIGRRLRPAMESSGEQKSRSQGCA